MDGAASIQFVSLLFRGDATKQLSHVVARNQHPVDDSLFSLHHHNGWSARLQMQLIRALTSNEVEQIVHAVHACHKQYHRAPIRGWQPAPVLSAADLRRLPLEISSGIPVCPRLSLT